MSHIFEIEKVGTPEEKFLCPPKALEAEIRSLAWASAVRQSLRGLPYFVPAGARDGATVKIEFHYPESCRKRLRDDAELVDPILKGLEGAICMEHSFVSWKNMRSLGSNRFFDPERKRASTKVIVEIEGDEIYHPSYFQAVRILFNELEKATGASAGQAIVLGSWLTKSHTEFRHLFVYFMNRAGAHILGTRTLNLHQTEFRRFQDKHLVFRSDKIASLDGSLRESGFYTKAAYFPLV